MNVIKTKTIELPTFEQLTEDEQQKVLENYAEINLEHEWYDFCYEDAKEIGVKIEGFDVYRGSIDYTFIHAVSHVAENIIKNHGEQSSSHNLATQFLKAYEAAEDDSEQQDDLVSEFETDIANYFLDLLKAEYEYAGSEEAIRETLTLNEYTFNRETLKIDS